MKKSCFGVLTLLMTLLLSSCGSKEVQPQRAPIVRLSTVQMATGIRHNSYPGKTQAADESAVAFKVAGNIDQVLVHVGDHVRQGQVLARMDRRDYEVQLNAVQAEYESVKAECERIIALYNDRGTSANNYDKARYGLQQITQKLQHAKDQLADCEIRAPFDGYVQSVYREAHEIVSAGMPVVSVFASRGIEVVINIPVIEYNRMSIHSRYTATFNSPERVLPLKLVSVSQKANANQLYEMRFRLTEGEENITPGLTTSVNIIYKEVGDLPTEIPTSAVFAEGDQSYVFVCEDSVLHKVPVRVHFLSSKGTMQILRGLQPGQRVVSAGVHSLSDGQRVVPAQEPSKTNVGGLL